ncbi:hypothetical protein FHR83_005397 [Actinoplanes campanulatus]|uniref:Uncharacterized protein n=1 Tax=Actinoplanes campanulatus TaxID=113559 RepID=A0A7W5AK16_9ACTN|nr:hypothetical protein [Actinoplanes campanulatus]MBB3097713.1 hypothetical protein [Actinoplanes campanulatus]GGN37949.1 hypothetical protein GCM10010109_64350 [Actinoplanes campanulatus]GID39719.1 hypothetical protein Aca09nite_62250 [Actinoplanes campanulatus]
MSAWIVDRDHLDLLLTAAVQWDLITADQADDTGRMLWKENLTSVAYRYPRDRDGGSRPGPHGFRDRDVDTYRYRPYPGRIDPEVIEAAAASLRHQSCEHPDWQHSAAARWVNRLHRLATESIPAFLAEYGPVDPRRQGPGEDGWYTLTDLTGQQQVRSADGWNVPDRDVLRRAAALRAGATP